MTPKRPTVVTDTDPVAELLTQADNRADVLQFSEYNRGTGRYDYLEQLDVEPVRALGLEEFVRQRYGGGRYLVRIRRRTGKYGPSATVSIAGDAKPRELPPVATSGSSATTPAPVVAAGVNSPLVERLLVTFAAALAPVLAKRFMDAPPAPDRLDDLSKLAALLKSVQQPAAAAVDPAAQVTSTLELLNQLAEYQRHMAPASTNDRGASLERVVERAAVPVINLLERKLALDAGRARAGRPALPASERADAASSPPSNPSPGESAAAPMPVATDPAVALLQSIPTFVRKYLLGCAESEKAPELYAELALDQLTDQQYAALSAHVGRADFLDVLCTTIPAYAPHRAWFGQFVDAIRASLATEAEPGGGAADSVNTSADDSPDADAPAVPRAS